MTIKKILFLFILVISLFACNKPDYSPTIIVGDVFMSGATFSDGEITIEFVNDSVVDFSANEMPDNKGKGRYIIYYDYVLIFDSNAVLEEKPVAKPIMNMYFANFKFDDNRRVELYSYYSMQIDDKVYEAENSIMRVRLGTNTTK